MPIKLGNEMQKQSSACNHVSEESLWRQTFAKKSRKFIRMRRVLLRSLLGQFIVPATFTNTRAVYRTENWQVRPKIDVARPCQPMLRNGPVALNFEDRNTIRTVALTNPQPRCLWSKTRPERAAVQSCRVFSHLCLFVNIVLWGCDPALVN